MSVQFSTVAQSSQTLCDPVDCSMPGLPVHHQLPKFTQTHVHWGSDIIQPSHPLSSPSPLAFNLSQHWKLFAMSQFFTSGGQNIRVSASTSVLPMNIQGWVPLGWTGWIPCNPRDSQESSPTPQFKHINSLALSFLHSPTLNPYMTTGKTIVLTRWTFVGKVISLLLNMLSSLVITFLPRSKRLLISWWQSLKLTLKQSLNRGETTLPSRQWEDNIRFPIWPVWLVTVLSA